MVVFPTTTTLALALFLLSPRGVGGQCAPLPPPPFSFTLGGESSSAVLARSTVACVSTALDARRSRTVTTFSDSVTGLVVVSTATTYTGLSLRAPGARGVEYELMFSANGTAPTPALCALAPLDVSLPGGASVATDIFSFHGSSASPTDFMAINLTLDNLPPPPPPPPGPPPLLPGVRLWGRTGSVNRRVGNATACRDACMALPACAGAVWATPVALAGCYLLATVDSSDNEEGFTSWVPFGGAGGRAGNTTTLAPNGGRSSDGVLPFFTVVAAGGEPSGALTVSVGWSGNWVSTITRDATSNATRIVVAHGGPDAPAGVCTSIDPAEPPLRSMRILTIAAFDPHSGGGYHTGANLHRRLLVEYQLPRHAGAGADAGALPLGALIASWSWFGWPKWPNMTLADQLRHVGYVKASASVEAAWVDAGWYVGGFPSGVGNWRIPPDFALTVDAAEFPNATLKPLADLAHASPNAVQWVVWFEPERVAAGTYIAAAHPEFLLNGELMDIGREAPRAYLASFLAAAVSTFSLDVLRLDFNTEPAKSWVSGDAPGREGLTELRYIAGLYELWDGALAATPGLLIDNCASGGRRIDLETLSRSVPLWRSDHGGVNASAQVQTMGLSAFAPLSSGSVSSWTPYVWRSSGLTGTTIGWGEVGWEVLSTDAAAMALLRAAVAEMQRLRQVAVYGDYFPLTPIALGEDAWAVFQLHCDPNDFVSGGALKCGAPVARGFLYAFRRSAATDDTFVAHLHGIDPAASYRLTAAIDSYDRAESVVVAGADLAALSITLSQPSGSALYEYEQVA